MHNIKRSVLSLTYSVHSLCIQLLAILLEWAGAEAEAGASGSGGGGGLSAQVFLVLWNILQQQWRPGYNLKVIRVEKSNIFSVSFEKDFLHFSRAFSISLLRTAICVVLSFYFDDTYINEWTKYFVFIKTDSTAASSWNRKSSIKQMSLFCVFMSYVRFEIMHAFEEPCDVTSSKLILLLSIFGHFK